MAASENQKVGVALPRKYFVFWSQTHMRVVGRYWPAIPFEYDSRQLPIGIRRCTSYGHIAQADRLLPIKKQNQCGSRPLAMRPRPLPMIQLFSRFAACQLGRCRLNHRQLNPLADDV